MVQDVRDDEQTKNDSNAGLIGPAIPTVAETEPRPICGHSSSWTGDCRECGADRTVCSECGIDVAASGSDGGSWVPFSHTHQKPEIEGWSFEVTTSRYRVFNGKTKREQHAAVYQGSLTEEAAGEMYRLATEAMKTVSETATKTISEASGSAQSEAPKDSSSSSPITHTDDKATS